MQLSTATTTTTKTSADQHGPSIESAVVVADAACSMLECGGGADRTDSSSSSSPTDNAARSQMKHQQQQPLTCNTSLDNSEIQAHTTSMHLNSKSVDNFTNNNCSDNNLQQNSVNFHDKNIVNNNDHDINHSRQYLTCLAGNQLLEPKPQANLDNLNDKNTLTCYCCCENQTNHYQCQQQQQPRQEQTVEVSASSTFMLSDKENNIGTSIDNRNHQQKRTNNSSSPISIDFNIEGEELEENNNDIRDKPSDKSAKQEEPMILSNNNNNDENSSIETSSHCHGQPMQQQHNHLANTPSTKHLKADETRKQHQNEPMNSNEVKMMISYELNNSANNDVDICSINNNNPENAIMNTNCGKNNNSSVFQAKPFALNQAINLNISNDYHQVDQCLNELVDDIKSPLGPSRMQPDDLGDDDNQNKQQHQENLSLIPDITINTRPISDLYDLDARPFARGKFAQVKRCVRKNEIAPAKNTDSITTYAAKCIKKRRRQTDIRHEILLEIEALKLSYITKHIVKLYEVYETPSDMILVLEMAQGGELQRVIDDEEQVQEPVVKRYIRQILDGLIYLHDNQIVHLDIKPQNILLTEPHPNGDIKLCDFGISRRITEGCEQRDICGTPDYVAPEILRYDPISLATDMWSVGVLSYVLLSGYSPFGSENKQQTFCNITQGPLEFPNDIFGSVSRQAVDFVKQLIVREPSGRLTSRQARMHCWLHPS